jgi:hypothetical protein
MNREKGETRAKGGTAVDYPLGASRVSRSSRFSRELQCLT